MNRELIQKLIKFRDDRNWKQFHTPENLAKSIVIEAGELLEEFQWSAIPKDMQNLKEEIADIVGYCLLLCEHYSIDIEAALEQKINKNNDKYPIAKSYGKSTKYDKLR